MSGENRGFVDADGRGPAYCWPHPRPLVKSGGRGNGSGEREEEDEEGEKDTAEEHHGAWRGVGRDHKGPRPPHQEAGDAPAMGATRGGQSKKNAET
jgi:hypothetical protein